MVYEHKLYVGGPWADSTYLVYNEVLGKFVYPDENIDGWDEAETLYLNTRITISNLITYIVNAELTEVTEEIKQEVKDVMSQVVVQRMPMQMFNNVLGVTLKIGVEINGVRKGGIGIQGDLLKLYNDDGEFIANVNNELETIFRIMIRKVYDGLSGITEDDSRIALGRGILRNLFEQYTLNYTTE